MTTTKNERWLESVGLYYNYHNIEARFMLAFEDFCEIVQNGRWAEYINGIRLPEITTFENENAEIFLNKVPGKNAGYSVRIKGTPRTKTIHYGTGLKARELAFKHLEKVIQLQAI